MEEKDYKSEKPFTPFQYEYINGHLVKKEEFNESIKNINEKLAKVNEISMSNTKNLKILLSVLKWLGGISGALVLTQVFNFFIELGGK